MFVKSQRVAQLEERLQLLEAKLEALEKSLLERINAVETGPVQPYDDRPIVHALEELQDRIQTQNLAIAEGIERVDRSERRVKQVVRRAQQKLAAHGFEDDGLEAEADQLRFFDGDGGGGGGVQPVREDVGSSGPTEEELASWSTIPGALNNDDFERIYHARRRH